MLLLLKKVRIKCCYDKKYYFEIINKRNDIFGEDLKNVNIV